MLPLTTLRLNHIHLSLLASTFLHKAYYIVLFRLLDEREDLIDHQVLCFELAVEDSGVVEQYEEYTVDSSYLAQRPSDALVGSDDLEFLRGRQEVED